MKSVRKGEIVVGGERYRYNISGGKVIWVDENRGTSYPVTGYGISGNICIFIKQMIKPDLHKEQKLIKWEYRVGQGYRTLITKDDIKRIIKSETLPLLWERQE